jgi:hypothetical protein
MYEYLAEYVFSPQFVFYVCIFGAMIVLNKRTEIDPIPAAILMFGVCMIVLTYAYVTEPLGNRWKIFAVASPVLAYAMFMRKRIDARKRLDAVSQG